MVGESLSDFLSVLFGYGKYLVPALFFLLGSMKWLFVDFEIHNQRFFGIVLLVLSTLGLLHL
ncbi:MAG: DNA translocase FtsK 4TM domain-containing protein [Patescibacteria group bacterium]|nr:DNA translocase FtsK 4TM domain-containing protein [Patescibacteria group bacterium]